jgi:HAD superfamily hydrolase (TIGR01509 family)
MIKGAIFDIDGVILDSMEMWNDLGKRYLSSMGIEAEKGLNDILFSMSMEEGARYLSEHYHVEKSSVEIVEDIKNMIENFYVNEVHEKDGAKELLAFIKKQGIKIVAATSSDSVQVEKALRRNCLYEYFEKIFTTSEIGKSKHSSDIYDEAARYLHVLQEETLVFEDSLYALKTAREAGYIVIAVFDQYGEKNQYELKMMADYYLEDYSAFKSGKLGAPLPIAL